MKRRDFVFVTLAAPAVAAFSGVLNGCGGSGSAEKPTSRGRGRFRMVFVWPERKSRLVPAASRALKVTLARGDGTIVGTRTIVFDDPQTSTVMFDDLVPGTVTLTATAYPLADGTGAAQATGAVSTAIEANQTTSVTLTMGSTIDRIEITPPNPTVAVGARLLLTATPKDAAGNVILCLASSFSWTTGSAAIAAPFPDGGQVINAEGAAVGAAGFTVTERESGKSGSATVTVTAGDTEGCVPGPVTGTGGPANAPWPMSGHDNAQTNRGGAGGATGVLKWIAPLEGASFDSAVIAADGTLYISGGNGDPRTVYALNTADGTRRRVLTDLGRFPLLGSNGLIYASNGLALIAADPQTGTRRWSLSGAVFAVIGADDTVYTSASLQNAQGTLVNTLLGVDGLTGATKWSLSGVAMGGSLGRDGTVYGLSAAGGLVAADGRCGTIKWTFQPAAGIFIVSGPSVGEDGTLYVRTTAAASADPRLYAVNPDGTEKWNVSTGRASSPPSLGVDGTLYGLAQEGKVTAYDPAGGAEKWSFTPPGARSSAFGTPSIASDGTVYFSAGRVEGGTPRSTLYALNGATGDLKWSFLVPDRASTQFISPVIGSDGTVYLSDDDGSRVIAVR
ncbi:MAG: PQQ-like beta-propeller repeat protein [Cytophagales bacterium]|nr:PQQ-like beta-propeller repeat protein [Armatimonadota bacterium]